MLGRTLAPAFVLQLHHLQALCSFPVLSSSASSLAEAMPLLSKIDHITESEDEEERTDSVVGCKSFVFHGGKS